MIEVESISSTPAPTINKIPFIILDVILVSAAVVLAVTSPGPLSPLLFALVLCCVAAGGLICCLPFWMEFRDSVRLTRHEISERQIAAPQWQYVDARLSQIEDLLKKTSLRLSDYGDKLARVEARPSAEGLQEAFARELAALRSELLNADGQRAEAVRAIRSDSAAALRVHDEQLGSLRSQLGGLEKSLEAVRELLGDLGRRLEATSTTTASLADAVAIATETATAAAMAAASATATAVSATATAADISSAADSIEPSPSRSAADVAAGDEDAQPDGATSASEDGKLFGQDAEPSARVADVALADDVQAAWIAPRGQLTDSVTAAAAASAAPVVVEDDAAAASARASVSVSDEGGSAAEGAAPADHAPTVAAADVPTAIASTSAVAAESPAELTVETSVESATQPPAAAQSSQSAQSAPQPLLPIEPETPVQPPAKNLEKAPGGRATLVAQVLIGIGNKPYVRGIGPGLSQDKGVPMQFVEIGKWQWVCPSADKSVSIEIYKNDEIPSVLGLIELEAGQRRAVTPTFPK